MRPFEELMDESLEIIKKAERLQVETDLLIERDEIDQEELDRRTAELGVYTEQLNGLRVEIEELTASLK